MDKNVFDAFLNHVHILKKHLTALAIFETFTFARLYPR